MSTLTRDEIINHLAPSVGGKDKAEYQVFKALQKLGWHTKKRFSGEEIISLGTAIAEDAQAQLKASGLAEDQALAEDVAPMIASLREDILPALEADPTPVPEDQE